VTNSQFKKSVMTLFQWYHYKSVTEKRHIFSILLPNQNFWLRQCE